MKLIRFTSNYTSSILSSTQPQNKMIYMEVFIINKRSLSHKSSFEFLQTIIYRFANRAMEGADSLKLQSVSPLYIHAEKRWITNIVTWDSTPLNQQAIQLIHNFILLESFFVYIFLNELFFLTWAKCTVSPQAHKRFESLRCHDQTKNWHVIISLDTLRTKNDYFKFIKG